MRLLPPLARPTNREAIRFNERTLTYAELQAAALDLAAAIDKATAKAADPIENATATSATAPATAPRVAIWAEPTPETCVAVVAALTAGVAAVPINPKSGERELAHIVRDSRPSVVLARPDAPLPAPFAVLPRLDVRPDPASRPSTFPAEPDPETPALVVYTSGTTGPPKGVVLPRRALASSIDALADAWAWTERDVLVHGLPLFHVHGLVLGVIGPLRRGGALHHLGTFSAEAVAAELAGAATMLFGVPTMYHRLAAAAEQDVRVAKALGRARLLVSGSAALSRADHEQIEKATGQRVVERYGMTETLMICSVRADGDRRRGKVGRPLAGVELRLVDDDGHPIEVSDGETVGEIHVRGPSLFLGYLNRPEATAEALRDGWFRTGDVATRDPDGYIRLIGRQATDLIKSGGFKIGAGEIEAALLDHPGVAEVAVTGEADPDLGERVVAWVVAAGEPPPSERELADHVAAQLAPHKRPRVVRYLDRLPRNDMGKVMKKALMTSSEAERSAGKIS